MIIILLLITLINSKTLLAQKQNKSSLDQYKNGDYITNSAINQYLGKWGSSDGKYLFEITKAVNTFKNKDLDFKADVLILKLIKTTSQLKKSDKIINKPLSFLSVNSFKANTILTDPTTDNEVDLVLMFKNKDLIELFTLNSINGDKRKGYYFPQKIILNKVK